MIHETEISCVFSLGRRIDEDLNLGVRRSGRFVSVARLRGFGGSGWFRSAGGNYPNLQQANRISTKPHCSYITVHVPAMYDVEHSRESAQVQLNHFYPKKKKSILSFLCLISNQIPSASVAYSSPICPICYSPNPHFFCPPPAPKQKDTC